MSMRAVCLLVSVGLVLSGQIHAIDHSNLDDHRPLRLEDAYSIAEGDFELEVGVAFQNQRSGPDFASFPLELSYGLLPNIHIEIGSELATKGNSGDLELGMVYNLNAETLTLPAFGIRVSATFPTGTESESTELMFQGMVTKSIGRLRLHLNGAYEGVIDAGPDERSGRFRFAFGPSYPIGAPRYTRTTVLGAIFVEQSEQRGEPVTVGAGIGFRHQLTERLVIDAGLESEFSGADDRRSLIVTVGASLTF